MKLTLTHLGTATLIIELQRDPGGKPLRLLTDPALDPAGEKYAFAFGTSSRKVLPDVVPEVGLGNIDGVLLSHDQHADNLDDTGRRLLPQVGRVFTTRAGGKRLTKTLGDKVLGMAPWQEARLRAPEGWDLTIRAVPARHAQLPIPVAVVGETTGFLLEWPGQTDGAVYISGDTVYFSGIDEIAKRYRVDLAILHLGCVKFGISGPLRYTFDGPDAVRAARKLRPSRVVPIHYDGWTHFKEGLDQSRNAFKTAKLESLVRPLIKGVATDFEFR